MYGVMLTKSLMKREYRRNKVGKVRKLLTFYRLLFVLCVIFIYISN